MDFRIFYRRHYKLALGRAGNRIHLFLRQKHLNVLPLLSASERVGVLHGSFEFNLNRRRFSSLVRGRGLVPLIGSDFKLLNTDAEVMKILFGLRLNRFV